MRHHNVKNYPLRIFSLDLMGAEIERIESFCICLPLGSSSVQKGGVCSKCTVDWLCRDKFKTRDVCRLQQLDWEREMREKCPRQGKTLMFPHTYTHCWHLLLGLQAAPR